MPELESEAVEEREVLLVPARFNERFIAYIVDLAPFALGYLAAETSLLPLAGGSRATLALAFVAAYVVYHFVGNLTGATVGKRLMGLRVVAKDGEPLGAARCLLRALGHVAGTPLANWGFVLALLHPEGRAFHDLLSGSVVLETRRRTPAQAALLFALAALMFCGLYASMFWVNVYRPTPKDLAAVADAEKGLMIMAQIQESWKKEHGSYAEEIEQLSQASGDPDKFAFAMRDLFDHTQGFRIEAGNRGYRIEGSAKDRFRSKLLLEGPPPRVRPAP